MKTRPRHPAASRRSFFAALCLAALALTAAADEPDVQRILTSADARCREIRLISYQARSFGTGALEKQAPKVEGHVTLEETEPGELPRIRAELRGPAGAERLVADGRRVMRIDDSNRTYVLGDLPAAGILARSFRFSAFMQEFMHERPFGDELEAESAIYRGRKEVGGVACHQIDVVYAKNLGEARWFFEVDGDLPRRVERVQRSGDDVGAQVLELSEIRIGRDVVPVSFEIDPPEGYERTEFAAAGAWKAKRSGLKLGAAAPDFALPRLDDGSITLSALRGKVVVLDFWASWARTCKLSIPRMETFREGFEPHDVQFIGVNVWEHEGSDPAALLKKLGAKYPSVRGTEAVAKAYQIESLPTWYVLDRSGNVVYAIDHFDPRADDALAEAIRKALHSQP